VIVLMHCNSDLRSAQLQALPILDCNASETAITRMSAHAYRAEGCRKSVELRCAGEPFDETYPCAAVATPQSKLALTLNK
jgi:hypothetical protein